jgi:hypothetical protein
VFLCSACKDINRVLSLSTGGLVILMFGCLISSKTDTLVSVCQASLLSAVLAS